MRFTTFSLVAVSAFSGLAVAQSSSASATSSGASTAETVVSDPNSVPSATRNTWCRSQVQSCLTLCGTGTDSNTCDINTLSYNCTCTSGNAMNVSDFSQTLPSLECEYAVAQCITDHPDDATAQAACHSVVCGNKKVESQASSSSSSSAVASATASSTGSASSSASATEASATASSTADSSASVNFGKTYGSGALVAGLVALFGFAL